MRTKTNGCKGEDVKHVGIGTAAMMIMRKVE